MSLRTFFAVSLVALFVSGCGSRTVQLDEIASLAQQSGPYALPDDSQIERLVDQVPSSAEEALLVAWSRELQGDIEGMRAALLADDLDWGSPLLETARSAMLLRSVRSHIDPSGELASWLMTASDPSHPLARWLTDELRVQAEVDEHVLSGMNGFPDRSQLTAPTSWRVAGPFSQYANARFGDEFAPETGEPVAEAAASLGLDAIVVPSDGRETMFRIGSGGVGFAETFIDVPDGFEGYLVVDTGSPFAVWVGETLVVRRAPESHWGAHVSAQRVALSPGTHRVLLKFGAGRGASVTVRFLDEEREIRAFSAGSGPAESGRVKIGAPPDRAGAPRLFPEPDDLSDLERLALTEIVRFTGAPSDAEKLYGAFEERGHPFVKMRRADLAFWIDTVPNTEREELALDALGEESAWPMLRLMRAYRLEAAGELEESLRMLERAAADAPESIIINHGYARALIDEGWDELAAPVLLDLAERHPVRCDLVTDYVELLVEEGRTLREEELRSEWTRCYDVQRLLVRHDSLPRGDFEAALTFARRAASYDPTNPSAYQLWYEVARAARDEEELINLRETAAEMGVRPEHFYFLESDDALSRGDAGAANDRIAELRETAPASVEAAVASLALSADRIFEDLRADGVAEVERYLAQDTLYQGPVVYVFDYLGNRHFEDGSSIEIVHQILQLRTRDALEQYGEMGVPWNAELLTARVIKPDGSTLSPESIPQKDSISMPNLEIGDFVELEWLVVNAANEAPDRYTKLPRFYFEILDAPLHLSRARYEFPESWRDRIDVDERNFDGGRSEASAGDFMRLEFEVASSPVPHPEPASPPSEEWLSSVQISIDYDWDAVVSDFSNFLVSPTALEPYVRDLVRRMRAQADDERDLAHRIFRYVNDDILGEGGYFSSSAATTLRMGEGDRLSALWAMLAAAEMRPSLVLAKTVSSDQTPVETANPDAYTGTLIRAEADGETLWLSPTFDYAAFDYVEPSFQGAEGYIVAGHEAGTQVTVRTEDPTKHTSQTTASIVMDADGNARGRVEQIVPLSSASGFATFLQYVESERQLVQSVEQQIAGSLPGARVSDLVVEGVEDRDAPIRIAFSFEAPRLATPRGDALVLNELPFVLELATTYAGYAQREQVLVMGDVRFADLELTIEAPAGFSVASEMEEQAISWRGNLYKRHVESGDGGVLRVTRKLELPVQRITPEDYAAFARLTRAVDTAEDVEVRFVRE